ncbi:tyrosine-type recombinase/integrase [Oscillospiraceae bacterium PP1C4]
MAEILKAAQQEQMQNRKNYGDLYLQNYYVSVKEKNRTYHEVYIMPVSAEVSESYNVVSLVCLRQDGAYEAPSAVSCICRAMKKRIDGFEYFHFHLFRHTYTSKLLANGAAPKDGQELLGYTDINTTLNVYAHATKESKRNSAMLLDATKNAV